jgi:hypothetical protein
MNGQLDSVVTDGTDVAVSLYTRRSLVRISCGTPCILTEIFQIFSKSIHVSAEAVPRLYYDYLFLNYFQVICHPDSKPL